MAYSTFTLPNGLRLIHTTSPTNVAYCGFAIDAGTDELPQEQGMAHFVEHLIFKGTEKRKAWHILNRMENVGGDLNAYTNKEETVIYSAFLKEHFNRAAELLADIVFHWLTLSSIVYFHRTKLRKKWKSLSTKSKAMKTVRRNSFLMILRN